MSSWKYLKLRVQAALVKGTAKDIDKAQEVVDESDHPDVIVSCLNNGKIRLQVPKKDKKQKLEIE